MIFTANTNPYKLWGDDYKPEHDYSKDYLTFEAIVDCTFSFYYPDDIGTTDSPILTHISYSVDNGETWVTEEFEPETAKTVTTPLIKTGETVLWKADGGTYDYNDGDNCYFGSDDEYNVYGNIMSLIYEDDFADKDTLLEGHSFLALFEENDIVSAENLVLPATTLTLSCYNSMFSDCVSLTSAPVLPATTLTENCYRGMFAACGGLNSVKMLATDISASGCLNGWISSATTGTLIINKDYEGLRSDLNVPYTWTILNEDGTPHIFPRDYSEEYLTFEALEEGEFDFNIPWELLDTLSDGSFSYSLDEGKTWITENTLEQRQDDFYINPQLSSGTKIMFKGNVTNYAANISVGGGSYKIYNSNFHFYSSFKVYGNIMSLIYGDNFRGKTTFPNNSSYNFAVLFANNDEGVIDVSNLILPAKTLSQYCYQSMFYGTELTTAPELPATTLANFCYFGMFTGCTSLIQAPVLPATTLASYCYNSMFKGCTSLTTAPELPATTLVNNCYAQMFEGCTNLNYIKAMFTSKPSASYTNMWVNRVAATGTFVKNSAATWNVTGTSGVPTGWTVETV